VADRVIFHIDVNSAFLSWSAVKILSEGGLSDVREVPSVVSGDPSDRRSIVAAKSIPAKRYGINTGEPVSMALRKCPSLVIVRSDFSWYRKCSRRFISICRKYSPVLEQFSIDECFLDMTGTLEGRNPVEVASALKDEVKARLGFTVNVGVGSNKLLAKMASDFEKPDKVHTLWHNEVQTKMWPLPVRDLLWVGKKTASTLVAYGIGTIGKLASVDVNSLVRLFGQKFGRQLHALSLGLDSSPVETHREEPKSYSAERTQQKDVSDARSLDRILFSLSVTVAHRMRLDSFRCSCVSVFVKDTSFNVTSRQRMLDQPTDVTALILGAARTLLPTIWKEGTPIRQVGLGVSHLTHEVFYQMPLFQEDRDNMDYYIAWDREYDLAHPREVIPPDEEFLSGTDGRSEGADALAVTPGADAASGSASAKERDTANEAAKGAPSELYYPNGEMALLGAKNAVRGKTGLYFSRVTLPDGKDCFEVCDDHGVVERHIVERG